MEKRTDWRGWSYTLLSTCRGELMGLAMLFLLYFHAFGLVPQAQWVRDFKSVCYCGVDVFILLSGMGLAFSLSRKKQSFGTYALRRFVRVLPTYWLVVGGYGLILRLMGRTTLKTVAWNLSTLFYWFNIPNTFNWYIPGLLFFYLMAPPCVALLRRCGKFRELAAALVSLGSFVLLILARQGGFSHLNDVIYRIPAFMMGLLLGIYLAEERPLTPGRLTIWAGGVVAAPLFGWLVTPAVHYVGAPTLFAFFVVFLCLAVSRVLVLLPRRGLRWVLGQIGTCSLEIYLLNVILVMERKNLTPFFVYNPRNYVYYAVTMTLNVLLGMGLHYALQKPLKWLEGKLTPRSKG